MDKKYILFIDSGMGGLSIAKHLLTKNDKYNILYYADTEHFPYGGKSEDVIGGYLLSIYNELKVIYPISMIVIACNTASVSALDYLRRFVDISVVGTVPAVKVASEYTITGSIGIIATATTVKTKYLTDLVQKFASDFKVYIAATPNLIHSIECGEGFDKLLSVINSELAEFKGRDIDTLVLGCTHFSFAFDAINSYFDNKVKLVDSREGVTKRIISLVDEDVLSENPEFLIYISGGKDHLKRYQGFLSSHSIRCVLYYKDEKWKKA